MKLQYGIRCFFSVFVGSFVCWFLLASTLFPLSVFAGIIAGGVCAVVSFVLVYLILALVRRTVSDFTWFSEKREIIPFAAVGVAWLIYGFIESRPQQRFHRIFSMGMSGVIEVNNASGTEIGIEGPVWGFTGKTSSPDIRKVLSEEQYAIVPDSQGEMFWKKRVEGWTGVQWEIKGNFEIFVKKAPGYQQRWILLADDGMAHLVFRISPNDFGLGGRESPSVPGE